MANYRMQKRYKFYEYYARCKEYCEKTGKTEFLAREVFPEGINGLVLRALKNRGVLKSRVPKRGSVLIWSLVK